MTEQLSKNLTWYEVMTTDTSQPMPENAERILIYLPNDRWFTMATFINDEHGASFVCHCTMDLGRPATGKIIDVGEAPLYWTRLSPAIPKASWLHNTEDNNTIK